MVESAIIKRKLKNSKDWIEMILEENHENNLASAGWRADFSSTELKAARTRGEDGILL